MYVYDFSMASDRLQLYICGTEMLSNMFVISLWAVKDYNYIPVALKYYQLMRSNDIEL